MPCNECALLPSKHYVVSGKMIGGFALIGWPFRYGVTGIRTLIINHAGQVFEKDLGTGTASMVGKMMRFNPDKSWRTARIE